MEGSHKHEITLSKQENVSKADGAIKSDFDVASKQSITIRDAKALGIEKDGSFFIISGTDEGVEKCKELIKDFVAEVSEDEIKKAKEEIAKESDAAAAGMGGIFG